MTPTCRQNPIAVTAILDSDYMCFRGLQLGVNSFAHAIGGWNLSVCTCDDALSHIEQVRPEGIILGPAWRSVIEGLRSITKIVGVCGHYAWKMQPWFPDVDIDDTQVGATAAEYFLDKGFREFAFFGVKDVVWSNQRREGFLTALRKRGLNVSIFEQRQISSSIYADDVSSNTASNVISWLRDLPKPVGLLACNDVRAHYITQVCFRNRISVPDDVSVLGVDNDDIFCALSRPPLSSVLIPWERVGFHAAELLHRQLLGEEVPIEQHLIPGTGVFERQSTDAVAVTDPDVRNAMQFIRANAHRLVTVDDVVNAGTLTRRTLERRFNDALSYTPLEAIRRAHLARAKLLLTTTEYSIARIAKECGFSQPSWFSKAFHEFFNESPAQYRTRATGIPR